MPKNNKLSRSNWQFMLPLGVTKTEDCFIFAVSVPNARECRLKIYDSKTNQLMNEYIMKQEQRIGSVFAIWIPKEELVGDCYLYEALDKEFIDPYAKRIIGRDKYGETLASEQIYGTWDFDIFDWSEDVRCELKYTDLIMYKLHVRGFTMNAKSGVSHKGTYRGVIEKIPYLKELGVNAVFLMPCIEYNEVISQRDRYGVPQYTKDYVNKGSYPISYTVESNPTKINFWGYTTDSYYFAPKASYASKPKECIHEFKTMVKMLHKASIEVILDMNFPKEFGPMYVLECLRFWVSEYHIDGFRVNIDSSTELLLATDPYLAQTKLLASHWNTSEIYAKEVEPDYKNLAQYNEGFLCEVRRFLKADEEQVGRFVDRFKNNSEKAGVINYITDHNGFTLNDLYMYDIKHNEANGENNHDGTDYNYSWNCGIEGPTRRKKVQDLRNQMRYNALAALFLSQGTPMLLAGDEFGNSQQGNNNAYCQDNEIGWLDWSKKNKNLELFNFVKQLIQIRKQHPVLRNSLRLRGMDYISCGKPDISFHGIRAWYPDYSNYSRTIGIMLCGEYAWLDKRTKDQSCYLIFNMHWESHSFDLPQLDKRKEWKLCMLTNKGFLEEEILTSKSILLEARTTALLIEVERQASKQEVIERKKA